MKAGEKARRRGREEWRGLVHEWRASGMRMKDFARQRGISASSLAYWSSTLGREPRKTAPKLLPVRVSPAAEMVAPGVSLLVGPLQFRFDGGTSPAYVAAVARALLATGSA
jgi:transposase-like protein